VSQSRVERDGQAVTIDAVPGSREVMLDITPAGIPFTADVTTAEEIRSLLGAAIATAQQADPR
jgi:hypothetical protein